MTVRHINNPAVVAVNYPLRAYLIERIMARVRAFGGGSGCVDASSLATII
jgi:hypothetical protein